MRKRNKGISLLEVMLSLAIIAIILVMATRYFSLVRLEQQTNDASNQINMVRAAAQRWLTNHNDYTDISIANLQELNLLPQTFTNPWGMGIEVKALSGDTIEITMDEIPVNACNNLANRFSDQTVTPAQCPPEPKMETTTFTGDFH